MTSNLLRIRPLGPFDLPMAVEIHQEAFGYEAWDKRAITDVLAMPGALGRLAFEIDGRTDDPAPRDSAIMRPLGFALILLVAFDAELLTIAVDRSARHRGIGTALVEDFLRLAGERGANNAFLEVAEDNTRAHRLYDRLGFRTEGLRRDYYRRPGNKRVAAHLLRRPLP